MSQCREHYSRLVRVGTETALSIRLFVIYAFFMEQMFPMPILSFACGASHGDAVLSQGACHLRLRFGAVSGGVCGWEPASLRAGRNASLRRQQQRTAAASSATARAQLKQPRALHIPRAHDKRGIVYPPVVSQLCARRRVTVAAAPRKVRLSRSLRFTALRRAFTPPRGEVLFGPSQGGVSAPECHRPSRLLGLEPRDQGG